MTDGPGQLFRWGCAAHTAGRVWHHTGKGDSGGHPGSESGLMLSAMTETAKGLYLHRLQLRPPPV